ncbi:hypothetical protein HGRIS_000959 [Hohenbuehelia grisea]|uniref:BTB domain-containing protein n=1 Tax=Hohenbuehelia grisea TaxID=104357 RepID=A0ABR3IQA9_9AGAR
MAEKLSLSPSRTSDSEHAWDSTTADIIIRTSDNQDFRVHKLILSLGSTFFQTIFSLPQPGIESARHSSITYLPSMTQRCGLDVIAVSEDGIVWDQLLRFCYPVARPPFDDLDQAVRVLGALTKYEFDGLQQVVAAVVRAGLEIYPDPFWIFALAYHYRLKEEAKLAASHYLRHPAFSLTASQGPKGLDYLSPPPKSFS